jgi:hypothetical protein
VNNPETPVVASAEHYDASAISAWYSLDWKYNLPLKVTTEQREALNTKPIGFNTP